MEKSHNLANCQLFVNFFVEYRIAALKQFRFINWPTPMQTNLNFLFFALVWTKRSHHAMFHQRYFAFKFLPHQVDNSQTVSRTRKKIITYQMAEVLKVLSIGPDNQLEDHVVSTYNVCRRLLTTLSTERPLLEDTASQQTPQ